MEQVESVPFSSLIAGMLLIKKSYTTTEVAEKISKLEGLGIVVDDENDDLDVLSCCINMDSEFNFHLGEGIDYNTVLYSNITVFEFLRIHTNELVMSFLRNDSSCMMYMVEEDDYNFQDLQNVLIKPKKHVRNLSTERKNSKINDRAIYG